VRGVPFIGLPAIRSRARHVCDAGAPVHPEAQGAIELLPRAIPMRADFEVRQAGARRELLRVRVTDQGSLQAFAVQNSAVLTSAAWADGWPISKSGAVSHAETKCPIFRFGAVR